MSTVKYLLDENVPEALADAIIRQEPAIELISVGQNPGPAKGTKDPELLMAAEAGKLTLITLDKRTVPIHVADHLAGGHHTWGVFILRRGFAIPRYVDLLMRIWSSTQAEEWQDRIEWLP